ncbi:hypothetical protein BDW22DRAFT_1421434 [Trametopsis cervina]|nr:hypothetical protein BDW22DRAFT_1421434 [Trametopsis cervina]
MRVMGLCLALFCLAFRHVHAQQTIDPTLSSVNLEDAHSTLSEIEVEAAVLAASPSSPRVPDEASTTPKPTPHDKSPSAENVADSASSSSSSTPSSNGSSSSARPVRSQSTSGRRPHAASASGSAKTHRIIRPTPIPSVPSPEAPPNRPLPPSHPSPPFHHSAPQRSRAISPAAIAFAVIGGVVGVFILFTAARCCYSWKRAPPRDRIHDVVTRHYLDREMEEREREDFRRRWTLFRASAGSPTRFVPPPPPYVPAPAYDAPAYDDAVHPVPVPDGPEHNYPFYGLYPMHRGPAAFCSGTALRTVWCQALAELNASHNPKTGTLRALSSRTCGTWIAAGVLQLPLLDDGRTLFRSRIPRSATDDQASRPFRSTFVQTCKLGGTRVSDSNGYSGMCTPAALLWTLYVCHGKNDAR